MIRYLLTVLLATVSLAGQATPNADSEFDELYSQSLAQAEGASIPQTLFQLAQSRAASGKSSFNNMGQLANYLADDFSLYSMVHSEIIQAHCKAEGANIVPYLAALASEGEPDATVAGKIYARLAISYKQVWHQLKPQALSGKSGLVGNFAGIMGIPASDLCSRLVRDPSGSAKHLAYHSVRASRSQVLRAIAP